MSDIADHPPRSAGRTSVARRAGLADAMRSPLVLMAVVLAAACALLTVPLTLPIGPMYWDLFIYFDAANRIADGQIPIVDFFAPVGPLGYYLFAGVQSLFPAGHPLLIVQFSLLAVTAPLMALVVAHVGRESRIAALALLIPFLVFSLLPFNTREFYPFPGSDGFGIYNRQVCEVLYVLVAALMFVRSQRVLAIVIAATITALFFLKITGFVSGALLCLFAFCAGRISFRHAAFAAIAFTAMLGLIEVSTGMISLYIADIMALAAMNSGTIAPRFLQAASHTFAIVAPAGTLAVLLFWWDRKKLLRDVRGLVASPGPASVAAFLGHPAFMLFAVLFAGILFETQNTGSQALIFLWPALLPLLMRIGRQITYPWRMVAIAGLAAAAVLPVLMNTVEKAARTYVGAVKNSTLAHDNLKTLGAVNLRPEVLERAERMLPYYAGHRTAMEDLVAIDKLPSPVLYSDFDFQIIHLMAIDDAITSIRALEQENGIRFEEIMNLNFVNPFPWLMDRRAPHHIVIGADPMRAVPPPGPEELNAVRETDLVLHPTCPLTTANAMLEDIYASALTGHRKIRLDRCFDAYVHPRFAGKLD